MGWKDWMEKFFVPSTAPVDRNAVALKPVPPTNYPPNAAVDQIFAPWDNAHSPGFALAVAQGGNIVYARGYGSADLDHGILIRPDTVFHACSLAKQFTAMAVMLLVNQNKLSLTDKVGAHISELPAIAPFTSITIEQMLHHISGIRDQWVLGALAGWRLSDDVISQDDVVKDLVPKMKTLNFNPGSHYSYSNTNYTLAGEIVKRVSGKSLTGFCDTHIFQPLGMTSTSINETHGQVIKRRAYGYVARGSDFAMRMPNYDLTGPTNLLTTVEDLMRWDRNFDLLSVGGSSALTAMQTPIPNSGDYGMGLFRRPNEGGRLIIEHDGRDPGYRSHFIRYPAEHLAIALLGNIQLPNSIYTGNLVRSVAAIYLNSQPTVAPADPAPPSQPTFAPASLTEYLGRYYSAEVDNSCDVVMDKTSLAMAHRQCAPAKMTATAPDIFTMTDFAVVLASAKVAFTRTQGLVDGFFLDDTTGADRLRHFRFDKVP